MYSIRSRDCKILCRKYGHISNVVIKISCMNRISKMQFPKHQMCHNYDELLLNKLIANVYLYYHFYFTGESLALAF